VAFLAMFLCSVTAQASSPVPAVLTLLLGNPPVVSVTAPSGGTLLPPGNVAVSASASGTDGTVTNVEFYAGTTLIGTATSSPYAVTWSNVTAGAYPLTAKAIDSNGNVTISAPVSITVDTPPTVTLTSPANNSIFPPPANVNLTANPTDLDGTITKVEFYRGTTLIATATAAPYQVIETGVPQGSYTYSAKAYDNLGIATTSAAVAVMVDAAPTVAITSPANNTGFPVPATVNLAASASDSDGTITKVEFYRDATLIATVTSAPYQTSDPNLQAGSYVYTARAYDSSSVATTSAPVNVTVAVHRPIYYIHTDHLNTPRVISNTAQQVVWRWDSTEPFGDSLPNENPSALGNFTCNLRFPGQYFDKETNLHYNYFRDYDPAMGRYIQSDPIGLEGGINTYSYVDSNPLLDSDADGLQAPPRGNAPRVTANQGILNATAQSLLNHIQTIQPNFQYTYVSPPGQGGYNRQMVSQLQQILLQMRQQSAPPPNFVVSQSGMCMPVPSGSGLIPVINQSGRITGQAFSGGTGGGPGLDPAVTQLRMMNPTPQYPGGYGVYMNATGQGVSPLSGQTLPPADPLRHIPY